MLRLMQLEEIETHLLRVPALAERYRLRAADFSNLVDDWMVELERMFQQNRLAAAAHVATARIAVQSAARGVIPQGIAVRGRVTQRKLQDAAAIDALRDATRLANGTITHDQDRRREGQDLVRRVVAVATAKGLAGFGDGTPAFSEQILWATIQSDSDTQGGAIQLEGLMGLTDALVLLNRGVAAR